MKTLSPSCTVDGLTGVGVCGLCDRCCDGVGSGSRPLTGTGTWRSLLLSRRKNASVTRPVVSREGRRCFSGDGVSGRRLETASGMGTGLCPFCPSGERRNASSVSSRRFHPGFYRPCQQGRRLPASPSRWGPVPLRWLPTRVLWPAPWPCCLSSAFSGTGGPSPQCCPSCCLSPGRSPPYTCHDRAALDDP